DRRLFQATSNGDLQFFEKLTDPNTLLQVTIEKNIVLHVAVQFDQLEAARKIVHLNSRLVYEANPKGNTPVHVAARVGRGGQFRMDRRLFQATSNGDLQFFEKLTDPNTLLQVTIEKNIVLHVAVQFDQLEAARKIVHLNSRLVYEANPKGNTPVHVAARGLKKNRYSRYRNRSPTSASENSESDGDTALHVAARNCNFQAVRDLVNEDPELANNENKAGESALFIAFDRECYRTAFCILDTAPMLEGTG
ncbi:protein accelerated cell death 6, partial [Quercus suber]